MVSKSRVEMVAGEKLTGSRIRGVVDVATGDNGLVRTDAERDAGQGGGAGEDVAAGRCAVGRARNLGVVGLHGSCGKVEKRGSGVGDGVDGRRHERAGSNGVSIAGEFPEAVGGLDGHVGDAAGIFAAVDVAEVVVTWGALLQVGGEDGRGKTLRDGVEEEGLLLVGGHRIDAVERKAEQAVALVADELGADGLGSFHGLCGYSRLANRDIVAVDIAARRATVAV